MKNLTAALLVAGVATTGGAVAETMEINDANLYYEEIGSGPAILLMHGGLGLSHDYLRPHFDILSNEYTIVYYDHLGNGQSDRPTTWDQVTFARLTSDAAELMSALGHDRFTLVGHSYGGFIAQEFAIRYPGVLDGLVLMSTVPTFDYQPELSGTDEQLAALGRMFSQPMRNDEEWRETWNMVVPMYFHQVDENQLARLDEVTIYEHQAWNTSSGLLATFNTLDRLPRVEVETLVVGGRFDGITPVGPGAQRIAEALPNAELLILEQSGHYPFVEENGAFIDSLRFWMSDRQR